MVSSTRLHVKGFYMSYKELKMHWHWDLLDGIKGFYEGSCTSEMSFKFGGIVWSIVKDDLDGKRSLIDFIIYGDQTETFDFPVKEKVILEKVDDFTIKEHEIFSGWILKSIEDDHVCLAVGTDYSKDLYPNVIFKHFNRLK